MADDPPVAESRARVAALREQLEAREGAPVRVIETHVSWVLLAGPLAYKLKKPVRLAFLDFTSLAERRRCCDEELRLNRRFAPDLYLDVVDVRRGPRGPCFDGDGEVVDCRRADAQVRRRRALERAPRGRRLVPAGRRVRASARRRARAPLPPRRPMPASARLLACAHRRRPRRGDRRMAGRSLVCRARVAGPAGLAARGTRPARSPLARAPARRRRSRVSWRPAPGECRAARRGGIRLRCARVRRRVALDRSARRPRLSGHGLSRERSARPGLSSSQRATSRRAATTKACQRCASSWSAVRWSGPRSPRFAARRGDDAGERRRASGICGSPARSAAASDPRLAITLRIARLRQDVRVAVAGRDGRCRARPLGRRAQAPFGVAPLDSSRDRVRGGIYGPPRPARPMHACSRSPGRRSPAAGRRSSTPPSCAASSATEFAALAAACAALFTILHCRAFLPLLRERIEARQQRGGDASEADVDVLDRLRSVAEPLDAHEIEPAIVVDAGSRRLRSNWRT